MKTLDHKLFLVIQEHSCGKPILVFCPTQKGLLCDHEPGTTNWNYVLGVMSTAAQLLEACQMTVDAGETLPWDTPEE